MEVVVEEKQIGFKSVACFFLSLENVKIYKDIVFRNIYLLFFFWDLKCLQITCENNGTCIKTGLVEICKCTDGFTGVQCEIRE